MSLCAKPIRPHGRSRRNRGRLREPRRWRSKTRAARLADAEGGHLSGRRDPRRHAGRQPAGRAPTDQDRSSSSAPLIVGKVARLHLLPGHAIPFSGVSNRKVVANGAEVKLVYSEGGLLIMTTGAALQDGSIGDIVKVRNSDSGVTVSGAVQPDGIGQSERGMMRRLIFALLLCLAAAPAAAVRIKDVSVVARRARQPIGRLWPRRRPPRHRRHPAQHAFHRAIHASDARAPGPRRARRFAAQPQRRLGHRHHGPAAGIEPGARLDVTVSALGDAPSLMGGTLLLTQLQAVGRRRLRGRARRGLRDRL